MVGEEYGWVALDGAAIMWLILQMLIVIIIPGFLLSLALFPKRAAIAMSERMALSLGLGLLPPFVLMLLNVSLDIKVNVVTSVIMFAVICAVSILAFLSKGGDLNLLNWYRSKDD